MRSFFPALRSDGLGWDAILVARRLAYWTFKTEAKAGRNQGQIRYKSIHVPSRPHDRFRNPLSWSQDRGEADPPVRLKSGTK